VSACFDAGDRGCADGLAGELRRFWATQPPGSEVEVILRDEATRSDVPSLARLLGHAVIRAEDRPDGFMVTIRTKESS